MLLISFHAAVALLVDSSHDAFCTLLLSCIHYHVLLVSFQVRAPLVYRHLCLLRVAVSVLMLNEHTDLFYKAFTICFEFSKSPSRSEPWSNLLSTSAHNCSFTLPACRQISLAHEVRPSDDVIVLDSYCTFIVARWRRELNRANRIMALQ